MLGRVKDNHREKEKGDHLVVNQVEKGVRKVGITSYLNAVRSKGIRLTRRGVIRTPYPCLFGS